MTRVLALAPNWLGDAVMATPALRALKRRFPDGEFAVAARGGVCALLAGLPWVDRFIPLPPKGSMTRWMPTAFTVRRFSPDIAVCFPHSFRAGILAWVSGARQRAGQARDGRSPLLTLHATPTRAGGVRTPIYMTYEYMNLVSLLGCEDDGLGLELAAEPAVIAATGVRMPKGRLRVGFAPGAAFGSSKRWLPERFAQVADALRKDAGAACILLTGPGEEDTHEAVQQAAEAPLLSCDGGRPTVETLKASISQLDLLICNDSGPRHVAVAFGVPTVCVMGPTDPAYSGGPYEKGAILRANVDCGPCQKPACAIDHRCMTAITADAVIKEALRILDEGPERSVETAKQDTK